MGPGTPSNSRTHSDSGDMLALGTPSTSTGMGQVCVPSATIPSTGPFTGRGHSATRTVAVPPVSPGFGERKDTGLQGDPPGCHSVPSVPGTLPCCIRGGNHGGAKCWRGLKGPFCAAAAGRGWQGTGTGTETSLALPPAICPCHLPFIPLPLPPSQLGCLGPLHGTGVCGESCQVTEGTGMSLKRDG